MPGPVTEAPSSDARVRPATASKEKPKTQRALELVALRGRDVVGVRHVLEGGDAWVGNVPDAFAKVAMADFGGQPVRLAEVEGRAFTLRLPPSSRARLHIAAKDLGVLERGPRTLRLEDGDRAVVVLGAVQIRARIVPIESTAIAGAGPKIGAAGWILFVGALYVAVLVLCSAFAPKGTAAPGAEHAPAAGERR